MPRPRQRLYGKIIACLTGVVGKFWPMV